MAVIGIAGYSGSGKTTIAQKLKQMRTFKAKKGIIISGDSFHGRAFVKYVGDEARRIYHDPNVVHDDGVLCGSVLYEKPDEYIRLSKIALPHAYNELQREIEKYDNQNFDVYVDWVYVPAKAEIYDKTILVDTDANIRHKRLLSRKNHSCSKEKSIRRDIVLHPLYEIFVPNYIIKNNNDTTETEAQIATISSIL